MKYFVYEDGVKEEHMFLFESVFDHDEIAKKIVPEGVEIVSAGFVKQEDYCNEGKPYCTGESMTLKLKCRYDEDNRILRRILRY